MKLSRNVEYTVLGLLIAYIAFGPRMDVVRQVLATPVGKFLALVGIVYVWKFVSAAIALLLVIMFIRCSGGGMTVWEGLEITNSKCSCPPGHTYNIAEKMCVNKNGKRSKPLACTCPPGYAYDFKTKECKQSSVMSGPLPTPEELKAIEPVATATAAPATTEAPATSTAPITTPGEASAMASTAMPPTAAPETVPTPTPEPTQSSGTESFRLMGYPLY
jgi:hypothetical protein